jgi:hypothetical protein
MLFAQGKYTYERTNAKRVMVTGKGKDKAAATVVLACAADGHLLKPQLIFKGKTARSTAGLAYHASEVCVSYVLRLIYLFTLCVLLLSLAVYF